MKYLKKYILFEKIHPNNTNINELDPRFVSDILDICADLNDQYPQTNKDSELVSFYSNNFRSHLSLSTSYIGLISGHSYDISREPLLDYPSISINMPYFTYGYSFGEMTKYSPAIECRELKETALRIKDFLGDAYLGFLIPNGTRNSLQVLNDDTRLSSGISRFQIVYNPKLLR